MQTRNKRIVKRPADKAKKENAPKPLQYTNQWRIQRSTQLLEFLLSKMGSSLSRNSVKSLLARKMVLVNGTVITQFDYPLAKDDEVKIARNSVRTMPVMKGKKGVVKTPVDHLVVYEDDTFLAINKPSGLLSVESDTVRKSAYMYAAEYMKARDPKARIYILHRIDRDTSGVLVFSKDIKMHSMLKMHWNEDIEMREYYAVVVGTFEEKKGTIVSYLKENANNIVYVSKDPRGKKAITHYEVVAENGAYSLLRVCIDTGRKNQIRVQMAHEGHPVVGDEKYGDGTNPLNRLGLHASRLDFVNPVTHKRISIKAPIPQEFRNLIDNKTNEKQGSL